MHIPLPKIPASYDGFSRIPTPDRLTVQLTRHELHLLALAIERQSDAAREDRQDDVAEQLDHRACNLRELAR